MSFTYRSSSSASANGTSTTTYNLTGQVGDLIMLILQHQGAAPSTVVDNAGNTYVKAISTMDSPVLATGQKRGSLYYCLSSVGAVTQVTVTCATSSALGIIAWIYDYTGTASFVNAQISSSSSTSPVAASPAGVLAGDMMWGAIQYVEGTAGVRQDTLATGQYSEVSGLIPSGGTTRLSAAIDEVVASNGQAGPLWTMSAGTTASMTAAFRSTVTNAAPVANAGPDQTVEPWTTVTLTGAASTDSDGTVASYAWTQTSGTAVTLSGSGATRTFAAPASQAGGTLVFSLIVTDNNGATSTADTVSIVVNPATEFFCSGGVWVPMQITTL